MPEKLLLHCCCAPCSSAIVEYLMQHGVRPTLYYCNPNIYPREEYERRKQECTRYAQALGLDIVDADYDHPAWLCAVKGLEEAPERGPRCLECFRYRLLQSARYALANGFPVLTTTLASSRWKNLEQVDAAGTWAVEKALAEAGNAAPAGNDAPTLTWWGRNWRKGGLQERRNALIKEWGFYNQTWCGCEFSARTSK
ncbi:MAG: epoxyqueuosine reductase QueH [Bacteroidales bacterium]|nr:epoxyqueuosine reductase QueH [Bacteroidales bacterium]